MDFLTYDVLDQNRIFEPKCLDEFPNLKAFMCRFEVMFTTPFSKHYAQAPLWPVGPIVLAQQQQKSVESDSMFAVSLLGWVRVLIRPGMLFLQALEKIAAFLQSDRFFKMPINNKMAKWGNKCLC